MNQKSVLYKIKQ